MVERIERIARIKSVYLDVPDHSSRKNGDENSNGKPFAKVLSRAIQKGKRNLQAETGFGDACSLSVTRPTQELFYKASADIRKRAAMLAYGIRRNNT